MCSIYFLNDFFIKYILKFLMKIIKYEIYVTTHLINNN